MVLQFGIGFPPLHRFIAGCVQTAMYQRSICFQHPLRKAVALCGKHIGHGLRNRVIGISPLPGILARSIIRGLGVPDKVAHHQN